MLPFALDRKYSNAATAWGWQFVFPASRICTDARWGAPETCTRDLSRVIGLEGVARRADPQANARGCGALASNAVFAANKVHAGDSIIRASIRRHRDIWVGGGLAGSGVGCACD